MSTALFVDESLRRRLLGKWYLGAFGHSVDCVATGEEALAVFDPCRHDLVITCTGSGGMVGAALARRIKERARHVRVLMVADHPPADRSNLDAVLLGPTDSLQFVSVVDRMLERSPERDSEIRASGLTGIGAGCSGLEGGRAMEPGRREYSGAFKAKVGLEALIGTKTMEQIALENGVHPLQVGEWMEIIQERLPEVFEKPSGSLREDLELKIAKLQRRIGQLTADLDWLKEKSRQLGLPTGNGA